MLHHSTRHSLCISHTALPHFSSLHTFPLSHSFHLCCSPYLRKHDPHTLRIINHNAPNDIKPFPFLHISVFTLLHIYRKQPNETSTPPHTTLKTILDNPASYLPNTPYKLQIPPRTPDHTSQMTPLHQGP